MTGVNFYRTEVDPNSSQHLTLLAWLEDHVLTKGLSPLTQPFPLAGERGKPARSVGSGLLT
jgi:hypothetical protein